MSNCDDVALISREGVAISKTKVLIDTLRSAQVRRISWVRGVGRLAVAGVASKEPSSVGRQNDKTQFNQINNLNWRFI